MLTYILVGEQAVNNFHNREWEDLNEIILDAFNGDIIAWNKEEDSIGELLEMLEGWDTFIELTKEDLLEIENNTKIEIV